MILAGSGIAAGGTGNANFLEIQINIPPQKMIMTPHKMMMTPHRSGHILYIFHLKHIVSEAKNINYLVLKWEVIQSRGDQ